MSDTETTAPLPPAADKTDGQVALEKLLALRDRLARADRRFKAVLASVGGAKGGVGLEEGGVAPGRVAERFFPALATLTAEIDRVAASLEQQATELERRF